MKAISLQELKSCFSIDALGAERIGITDIDGTMWVLTKQSVLDGSTDSISELDKRLIRRIAEFAVQEQTISASAIQRNFRIGYARACKILDYMEAKWYISPETGIEPRKVFITQSQIDDDFK